LPPQAVIHPVFEYKRRILARFLRKVFTSGFPLTENTSRSSNVGRVAGINNTVAQALTAGLDITARRPEIAAALFNLVIGLVAGQGIFLAGDDVFKCSNVLAFL